MSTEDVLPGNPVSIMGRRVKGGRPSNLEILQFVAATGLWENVALPPGTPHDLLDGVVDQDTVASPVVKGGLIFGNATPKWDQLPRAAADGAILYQNSQLPAWLAVGANGHILNISGGLPAWLNLTAAGYVKGGNPLALQTGIPLADLLNAGGANGDIIYWNGTNWVRLAIGSANQVLQVSGGIPAWATSSNAGTKQAVYLATTFTGSSATFADVTGMSITMPNTNKMALVTFTIVNGNSSTQRNYFRVVDNATNKNGVAQDEPTAGNINVTTITLAVECTGQVVKLQYKVSANTATVYGISTDTDLCSQIQSLEL